MKKLMVLAIILLGVVSCFAGSLIVESQMDSLWLELGGMRMHKKVVIGSKTYATEGNLVVGVFADVVTPEDIKQVGIQITDIYKKKNGKHRESSNGVEVVYDLYTEPCQGTPCFTSEGLNTIHIRIEEFYINGEAVPLYSKGIIQRAEEELNDPHSLHYYDIDDDGYWINRRRFHQSL